MDTYLGSQNAYYANKTIEKIIVQKCIPIERFKEYVIDFVSFQGKHYCVGILQYVKSPEGFYREYIASTLTERPEFMPLVQYVEQCLNALGVQNGCTHNEIFWDDADTYYLIESNNRSAGNGISSIYHNTYGYSPLSTYIDLIEGKRVANYPTTRQSYSLVLDIFNFHHDKPQQLNLEGISSFERIVHFRGCNKLPADLDGNYTRADCISAAILLKNDNQAQLQDDVKTILAREKEGRLFSTNLFTLSDKNTAFVD